MPIQQGGARGQPERDGPSKKPFKSGAQIGNREELALMDPNLVASPVVEDRRRQAGKTKTVGLMLPRICEARIAHGNAAQQSASRAICIVGVDPDEGDSPAKLRRHLLEQRSLGTAWWAPRGPEIHHDGEAPQGRKLVTEPHHAAGQEPARLIVEPSQWCRRALDRALLLGQRTSLRALSRRGLDQSDADDDPNHKHQTDHQPPLPGHGSTLLRRAGKVAPSGAGVARRPAGTRPLRQSSGSAPTPPLVPLSDSAGGGSDEVIFHSDSRSLAYGARRT